VNNKIIGAGEIGDSHFTINNQSSGVPSRFVLEFDVAQSPAT
jgi:hypothetical protein